MGFDAFFPQMYVVTQNELLWTTDQWGAIAVSVSSCCRWLFTFGMICPRSCLLSGGAWVLTLGQASARFSSWVSVACGWEKTPADEQGLIVLGRTSGAREAEAGWLEKQEARWCWHAALGDSMGAEEVKRITRWKMIASKGRGTLVTGRSLLPIAPYLMCLHSRDVSTAWAVWNLCGWSSK